MSANELATTTMADDTGGGAHQLDHVRSWAHVYTPHYHHG